jgi:UDP-3-O-[3-hydroxymyristoyl] glucosamine N-acyltransferase
VYRIIKISILLLLIISVQGLFGQTTPDKIPNGIAIQSVARDANGNAASNRNIYLKVELREGTATGESVLLETHQVTSNDEGIFNFYIGQGTRVSGINSLIFLDWKGKIYFLNIKMAIEPSLPTPGWVLDKEYVDLGTSQIWSVPYAFTSYRSVVADSATSISGILAGANGGTGVSNVGKTITLGRNFEIQGLGNLKFNTVGPTNLTLPLKGTLVTSESLDTLINKFLLSPTFLGSPKTPTVDTASNDSTVASTKFVKSVISGQINELSNKLSTTLDTTAGAKLKISDTLAMLSNRFERDTASLSNRINLKVNTLNARIDSSLYVKGLVKIDSVVTINDSLRVKGNVLIDTNLTVGKDLEIKGNLILNSGLQFNDSLIVSKGARIEQSILAKSKLYVSDSVLAKGNVKIDNNLNVGKVTSLNDSLYVKGQARFDSLLTINDSLRVKGNVLIDTNLTVGKDLEIKGNLILNSGLQFNDSLIVSKGARIEQSILAKSKLYVSDSLIAKSNVKIDNNLNVGKVTSLNDSLYVKGQARFDSLLTINDSLRVKGNVLIDSNLTVLGKLSLSTALQFNDSLIVSKGARIDQSILAKSKLYVSDSILAKGNVKIDSNLYVKGLVRFDSLLTINDSLRVKGNVLIDSNLTVNKVTTLNDSLYVKGKVRFDSLLTINDSLRVKGNVLIDTNLTVNKVTTLNDSLIVKSGVRIDQSILAKSKLTVTDSLLAKGNVKIDNNLFVKGRNIDDSIMRYTWSKLNVSDTANMLYDYLRKINDLYSSISASNGEIANKLAISDTAFLLQKRDTFTLSNRINLKLNLSDTASMLSNRIQRDTASLSRRIEKLVTGSGDLATTKLNITDTSFLLAKIDTANMLSSRFKRDTAYLSRRLDLLDQATFVNNNLKLNITDTSNLLQKKDTITLSNRIDALAQSSNVFTTDITLNMGGLKTFGKYNNGETIPSKGKTLDEVMKDIVTLVIHPTYNRPTAGLTMNSSGLGVAASGSYEIGTNLGTLTYSPGFTQNDGGNFTLISYKKNSVELASNSGSPSVTDNVGTLSATTNYQITYTYGAGTTVKKNNINVDDPFGMVTASTVNSGIITLTPFSNKYWGVTTNTAAFITDANILEMAGGSKEPASSKLKSEFTITGSGVAGPAKYAFYAVPHNASGTITSIKAGGFESIAAFDVITRDFVNGLGYKVSYDIYVQKNSGTDNVTLIIN